MSLFHSRYIAIKSKVEDLLDAIHLGDLSFDLIFQISKINQFFTQKNHGESIYYFCYYALVRAS